MQLMHVRMMPTLLVQMLINGKFVGMFRALADSGYEAELVHHNTIAQWYMHSTSANVNIVGLAQEDIPVKRKIEVELRPWFDQGGQTTLKITLWILPKTNQWSPIYPERAIPPHTLEKTLPGPLANPLFWQPSKIHLLLGIEVMAMLMMNCQSIGLGKRLVSQNTSMGNVILGATGDGENSALPQLTVNRKIHVVNMNDLDKSVQRLWHFEDLELCTKKDAENEYVDEFFAKTHWCTKSGRHVVSIPMNPQITALGSSKEVAYRRFLMQERKFARDSVYRQKYVDFMREMISLGHMVECKKEPEPNEMTYHIPHHGIISSKSFRVVFDRH